MSKSYVMGGTNPLSNKPQTSAQRRDFQEFDHENRRDHASRPTPQLLSPFHILAGFEPDDYGGSPYNDDLVESELAIDCDSKEAATMPLKQLLSVKPMKDPFEMFWSDDQNASKKVSLGGSDIQSAQGSCEDPQSELSSPSDRKTGDDVDRGPDPNGKPINLSGGFADNFNQPQNMDQSDYTLVCEQWSAYAKTPPIDFERATSLHSQGVPVPIVASDVWRALPHNLAETEEYSQEIINAIWPFAYDNSSAVTIEGIDFASATPSEKLNVILAQKMTNWGQEQWVGWFNENPDRSLSELRYDECVALLRRGDVQTYTGMQSNTGPIEFWMAHMPFPFGCRGAPYPFDHLHEGYSVSKQNKRLPESEDGKKTAHLSGGDIAKKLYDESDCALVALHVFNTQKAWVSGNLVAVRNEYGLPCVGPHFLHVNRKQTGDDNVKEGEPEKMNETHQWKGINGSSDLISAAKLTGFVRAIVSPRQTIGVIKASVPFNKNVGCHVNCDRTKGGQLPEGLVTKKKGRKPKKKKKVDERLTVSVTEMSLGTCCSILHVASGTAEMNESNKGCWGRFAMVDAEMEGNRPVLAIEVRDFCRCTIDTAANPGGYKCTKIQWAPKRVSGVSTESLIVSSRSGGDGGDGGSMGGGGDGGSPGGGKLKAEE